jgi:predicted MFS family arabinose efflux permease
MVSVFAMGAAFGGPILVACLARFPARQVLACSLMPFLGNLVFALSPDFGSILALRAIQGAALPVFMSFANVWMAKRYGTEHGTSLLYMGVVAGGAVAPPIGASLTVVLSWKSVMMGLGFLVLPVIGAALMSIKDRTSSLAAQPHGSFVNPYLLAHLALTVLTFAALFASYSHIAEILRRAGFQRDVVGLFLLVFGVSGFAGNWFAAKVAARPLLSVCCATGLVTLCSLAVESDLRFGMNMVVVLAALWGCAYAASFVLSQARLMRAGPQFPAFAGSLNISAGNIGIAIGAALGGLALSHTETGLPTGSITLILAVFSFATAWLITRGYGGDESRKGQR